MWGVALKWRSVVGNGFNHRRHPKRRHPGIQGHPHQRVWQRVYGTVCCFGRHERQGAIAAPCAQARWIHNAQGIPD